MSTAILDPTAATQTTIDVVTRTIETPMGFRLRIPLPAVHLGVIRRPAGTHAAVIWREAEVLLQQGFGVDIPTRHRGHLRVEFYGRLITAAMVGALGRLKRFHDRHPESLWADRGDYGRPSHGDWARLEHWGLIEARPHDAARRWRGWWRLTGLGHRWLRGAESVPRSIVMVDGTCVGFLNPTDRITVHDVDAEFSLDAIRGADAKALP